MEVSIYPGSRCERSGNTLGGSAGIPLSCGIRFLGCSQRGFVDRSHLDRFASEETGSRSEEIGSRLKEFGWRKIGDVVVQFAYHPWRFQVSKSRNWVFGVGKKKANRDQIRRPDRSTGSWTGRAGASPGQTGLLAGQTSQNRTPGRCQPGRCPKSHCVSPVFIRRQARQKPDGPVPRPVRPDRTPAESESFSTESRSGSVCISYFRPLVVLTPYISAQDAPKIGLDHV